MAAFTVGYSNYLHILQVISVNSSFPCLQSSYGQESPGWISLFKLVIFLLLKITRHLNFIVKIDWSMNSGWPRTGIARAFKKKYFYFQNSTKMVTKLGQTVLVFKARSKEDCSLDMTRIYLRVFKLLR